jgi:hypothetical protein
MHSGEPADPHADVIDWEAVRVAPVVEVCIQLQQCTSEVIQSRSSWLGNSAVLLTAELTNLHVLAEQVAEAIQCRGMHMLLATRIQAR